MTELSYRSESSAASLLRPHVNDSHIRFRFQRRSLRLTSPWHPRKPQQGSRQRNKAECLQGFQLFLKVEHSGGLSRMMSPCPDLHMDAPEDFFSHLSVYTFRQSRGELICIARQSLHKLSNSSVWLFFSPHLHSFRFFDSFTSAAFTHVIPVGLDQRVIRLKSSSKIQISFMSEYCDAVWNSQLSLLAVIQPNSNSTAAHHQGVTKSLCCVQYQSS